jgi:Uma2 family endonuclease
MSAVLDLTQPQAKLITADELLTMPDTRFGYELVRGEIKKYMPAGNLHGFVASRINRFLGNFVDENNLGAVVAAETGFTIFQNPDTVRAPDAAFIGKEKLSIYGITDGFFPVAPDLAVEVVSPYDRKKDIESKIEDYLAADVKLIWVVYPQNRIVTVHRPNKFVSILRADDELDGEDILPGFNLLISRIFENLPTITE